MNISKTKRIFTSFTLSVFIFTNILIVSSGLLLPKKADAFLGIGDFSFDTIIANPYDVLKDVGIGAARQVALRLSEKFISRFTNKLVDKYKIRNFLYYDQVLSNYYLGNFIRDKISDPDLREIYTLLEGAYITGQPDGTVGGPDRQKAILVQLKEKINKVYEDQTGITEAKVANKPADMSNRDYFAMSQEYYFNNVGFTTVDLQSNFTGFASNATAAAQLEVLVGNGLKAGRFIGGTCSIAGGNGSIAPGSNVTNNTDANSPESCRAQGGNWQPSLVDQARSFIDNPSQHVKSYLDAAIKTRIDANFNPNNFWSVIGSLLGNFLFNQFALGNENGTLNEDPRGYAPAGANEGAAPGTEVHLDGDGIADGFDYTGDGAIDICSYGYSEAGGCKTSSEAANIPDPSDSNCADIDLPMYDPQSGTNTTGNGQLCV